jgi:outer membrane protein assembly factor BamB
VCGAGERVVALDAASGDLRWERDVYGQVLDHVAFSAGFYAVVATEAGMVYLLGDEGTGSWKWQLPARPTSPPTAGPDSIFVNCRDGRTHALAAETDGADGWDVDTGWVEHGIGLFDSLVVLAGNGALRAFDADSGDRRWQHGIGDWRHTAPAVGRDTVFVGGDRLRALDPTPGGDPDGGPALRFEREFAGRVGPGPVLDDGTLYVIAEVEADEYALLALE